MSDSESEGGEGPPAATQESRSQPWHCSQGEHSPLLGSWRKEKQFPGAGSDRNTTPPGARETGPESKRTRLLPGSAWAKNQTAFLPPHTGADSSGQGGTPPHPTGHNYLHTQAILCDSREGHLTLGTKQRLFGGGGKTLSGPLKSHTNSSVPQQSQCPSPHPKLVLGRGHLQQPPSNSKNLKNVSFNLRAPGLGQASSPQYLGSHDPRPTRTTSWEERAPLGTSGPHWDWLEKQPRQPREGKQEALAHPSPTSLKVIGVGGRGQFLSPGLQGLALGRCQMFAGYVRQLLLQQGNCT